MYTVNGAVTQQSSISLSLATRVIQSCIGLASSLLCDLFTILAPVREQMLGSCVSYCVEPLVNVITASVFATPFKIYISKVYGNIATKNAFGDQIISSLN